MLLLEELVDGINSKGKYKISFMMDNAICTGNFRTRETDRLLQDDNEQEAVMFETLIDTNRLWNDYQLFLAEDKEYFIKLSKHLEETNDYGSDKTLTSIFNHMVVFLMDKENTLDDYLTTDDIPEVIYHLYKRETYHEYYVTNGAHMEPLSIF